jgi:hypothetical protein
MLINIIQIIYCLSMAIIEINLHLLCLPTQVIVFCYICRRIFSERISLLFEKSSIIKTLIIPQELVDVQLKCQPDTMLVFGLSLLGSNLQ